MKSVFENSLKLLRSTVVKVIDGWMTERMKDVLCMSGSEQSKENKEEVREE